MSSILGVDVGGTKVAAAPVDRTGATLAPPLVEPSEASSPEAFLCAVEATLRRALAEFEGCDPLAVGLACAGTVDVEYGVVVTSPNLPLVQMSLAQRLEEALGIPVTLENDANAAVRAESVAGAATGLKHVVMLTLGTGVGGGLLLDGRVYRGAGGGAGELGHTIVQTGGLPCRCGAHGCLEMYASGPALVRYASARVRDQEADPEGALLVLREKGQLTGGAVTRLALQGHPGALEAVKQLAGWLGVGLVNISNTFNPEMIVVGGGVGELGELLLAPTREFLQKNAMAPGRDQVRVTCAKLGNQAGLIGAGLAAWEALAGASGADHGARESGRGATASDRDTGA
jgi:glucokinase